MWRATPLFLLALSLAGQVASKYPPDHQARYSPAGIFGDDSRDAWYSSQLQSLDEPTLSGLLATEQVYRFTWLRTFHHPIAVRVSIHPNGTATITTKMASGTGGYAPGQLIVNTSREIGAEDVRRLLDLIRAMDFWNMPAELPPGNSIGLDGAQWIFEAARNGNYHVVDRWSPKTGPIRTLGLRLIQNLARLPVPADTIY